MNAMENKKCKWCCDYFSRKIGSEVSECLDCKNERESDIVEKLPTKKEVTERLQNACDEMNYLSCGFMRFEVIERNGNALSISLTDRDGKEHLFGCTAYRPEPKPPEKNALIIYVDKIKGNMELMSGFSSGFFSNGPESPLCITKKYNREPAFYKWDMTTNKWYCPSTDHKFNWRDEWTPEEFRK